MWKQVVRVRVRLVLIAWFAFDVAWLSAVVMHVNDWRLYSLGNLQRPLFFKA